MTPAFETRRFTRVEYERLIETAIFQPLVRLELIDGLLVLREPQNSPPIVGTQMAQRVLDRAFGAG